MQLWQKVIIGLILGVIAGVLLKEKTVYIKPIGTIFINMIKMVVVPLIFFSIISGITSMEDKSKLGKVGAKSTAAYLATAMFAVVIGLVTASIFKPGVGVNIDLSSSSASQAVAKESTQPDMLQMLVDIVPTNAIGAMAEGHILQVVFFAIFVGITINLMGDQGKRLIEMIQLLAAMVFKMIGLIIKLSPYGVFALISWVVGTQGMDVLISLAKLVVTVVFACGVQFAVFALFILVFARLSPLPFFKKSIEYQALAFSTSSSKATLPTTMAVCQERLGISKAGTSFVLPLGASINMDGTAIYLGICAVFFAQVTGVELHFHEYLLIILTSTLASIGAAGIPGGALIMMGMVLSTVGLPLEGIALIAGVDRILDMLRTTINITGDAAITLIIDKSEGMFNEEIYHSK